MKTGIGIYRVSKNEQDYNRQVIEVKEFCKAEDIELIGEFAEKETGSKRVRKSLTEALDFCEEFKPDFCITSELSRIGRTDEVLSTVKYLKSKNINFISLKEGIRLFNKDGSENTSANLLVPILSGINSYFLDGLNYSISSGLKAAALKGHYTGGKYIPYGYKKLEKMLVIDENESVIITNIFNLYCNGYGARKIVTFLKDNGFKPKFSTKWDAVVIHQILDNSLYCGMRKYKGEIIPAPAIISVELFEKAQAVKANKTNCQEINKKYEYLLNNKLVVCGCCGLPYFGKKMGKRQNTYNCSANRYGVKKCNNYGINIDDFEASVSNVITNFFPELLIQNVDNSQILKEMEINNRLISGSDNQLKDLKKQESRLIDLSIAGNFSEEIINQKLAVIRKSENSFIQDLSKYQAKIKVLNRQLKHRNNYKVIVAEIKTNGINKELLHRVVTKIVVTPAKTTSPKTTIIDVYADDMCVSYSLQQRTHQIKYIGCNMEIRPVDRTKHQIIKDFEARLSTYELNDE